MRELGKTVIVATKNAGKVKEFSYAFGQLGIAVRSMFDYEGLPAIVEDGTTFAENARIKAAIVGKALRMPVLADDSGLEVDALGGAPGIYSARYAGEGAADADNNAKLLRELEAGAGNDRSADFPEAVSGVPDGLRIMSRARFRCALALYDPNSDGFREIEGAAEGCILSGPLGDNGFGYDPLFWLPAFGRTMAQLKTEEKQAISHRGHALRLMIEAVRQYAVH
jgi:XTP/dITP diphosphohydrolase